MLTCKDVATAIGRGEWRAAALWRRLALRLHLLLCPHCRRYADQIQAIGTAARRLFREQGEDPKALEPLQKTILSRLEINAPPKPNSGDAQR